MNIVIEEEIYLPLVILSFCCTVIFQITSGYFQTTSGTFNLHIPHHCSSSR